MYVDTPAMELMWSSMNNLPESVLSLYHLGLRDWAQVLGLMTSTVTHRTISLALTTKILCNRRALYYRTWIYNITTFSLTAFLLHWYLGFFWYTQKALFQTSVVWCVRRHTVLLRSPYNGSWPDSAEQSGMPAHLLPSSSRPPIQAGLQKCLVWPWWVMHVPFTVGVGWREITITCPVSWKSPSCFSSFI